MTNKTGYIIVILILVGLSLWLWFKNSNDNKRMADALLKSANPDAKMENTDNQDGDIKCELRDSYGRMITITGRGAEFEKLCLERGNQQQYLYGYYWWPINYYTWYRPWGWRHWSGGRHPIGGHGSMTGGGTGGGGQTGTGAGTGTPGTGTP